VNNNSTNLLSWIPPGHSQPTPSYGATKLVEKNQNTPKYYKHTFPHRITYLLFLAGWDQKELL
jgi:hypothetical protein